MYLEKCRWWNGKWADNNGQFFFYNVAPGQHSLVFSKKSYKEESRVIMQEADHCMQLDIVFQLEDIIVTSEAEA